MTVALSPPEGLVLPAPADAVGDARRDLADQLVEEVRVSGVSLVGPVGAENSFAPFTRAFAGGCWVGGRVGPSADLASN